MSERVTFSDVSKFVIRDNVLPHQSSHRLQNRVAFLHKLCLESVRCTVEAPKSSLSSRYPSCLITKPTAAFQRGQASSTNGRLWRKSRWCAQDRVDRYRSGGMHD